MKEVDRRQISAKSGSEHLVVLQNIKMLVEVCTDGGLNY